MVGEIQKIIFKNQVMILGEENSIRRKVTERFLEYYSFNEDYSTGILRICQVLFSLAVFI